MTVNRTANSEHDRVLDYLLADETERQGIETNPGVETVASSVVSLAQLLRQLDTEKSEDSYADERDCARAVSRLESLTKLPLTESGPLRFLRNYELLDELGSGGMGVVFRAKHTKLDKHFAVKVLSPKLHKNQQLLSRFDREMRAAGKIEHENVVCATDADEVGGIHFLAMELVDGANLAQLVKGNGPLAIAEACEITRRAALGLGAIHAQGLVHRDVKPSNLMINAAGQIKVMDLGLALLQDPAVTSLSADASHVVGTIQYMAPEQLVDSHRVDGRADLFSLGCTLHYLLVGQPPTHGRHDSIDHVELDRLLDRLLAIQPEERFTTAAEVATAIDPLCTGADLGRLAAQAHQSSQATVDTLAAPSETRGLNPADRGNSSQLRVRRGLLMPLGVLALTLMIAGSWSITRDRTGELVLRVDDPGAEILVDGQPSSSQTRIASGEVRLTLPVGSHDIEIKSAGHDPWTDMITITSDVPQSLVIRFDPSADRKGPASKTSLDERQRGLAEWVLHRGGSLRLYPRGDITMISDLPEGSIRIQSAVASRKGLRDEDAPRFIGMSNLQGLELSHNQFTSGAAEHLAQIPTLRWLYLAGNYQLDDGAAEYLSRLENLESLDLSNTRITSAAVTEFKTLTKLRELKLGYTKIGDDSIADLGKITSLVRLDLRGTAIGDKNLAQLRQLPELKYLLLSSTLVTDEAVPILCELTALTELELKATQLSDAAMTELRRALPKCQIKP